MQKHTYSSLPVYQKSLALLDLSKALASYFSPDTRVFSQRTLGLRTIIAESLAQDAALIPSTIAQVYETESNSTRLKNATFINVITRNILSYCNGLENDGVKEREYLQLLRRETKIFRKSFKQWRKSISGSGLY